MFLLNDSFVIGVFYAVALVVLMLLKYVLAVKKLIVLILSLASFSEYKVNIGFIQLDSLLKKERSIKPILTLYSENDASDSINTINFLTAKTHLSNIRTTNATA